MLSCNTYCLTWVSLTLHVGYLFTAASKAQPLLLTLDEGYLLTAAPPDLECGVAPLGLLRLLSRRFLDVGLLLSTASPDLRCGVGPLSRHP